MLIPQAEKKRFVLPDIPCGVCHHKSWLSWYWDEINVGQWLAISRDLCAISRCAHCGTARLHPELCPDEQYYVSGKYQLDKKGTLSPETCVESANKTSQERYIWAFGDDDVSGKVIADIGCSAGAWLDNFKDIAKEIIAIEPCAAYNGRLKKQGYHTYQFTEQALEDWKGKVEYIFCFELIEHVENPTLLLNQIKELLTPDGTILLSTPNLDCVNVLMTDIIRPFFYEISHIWYFSIDSLKYLLSSVGLNIQSLVTHQRDAFWEFLVAVTGNAKMGNTHRYQPTNDEELDKAWKEFLTRKNLGYTIFCKLSKT